MRIARAIGIVAFISDAVALMIVDYVIGLGKSGHPLRGQLDAFADIGSVDDGDRLAVLVQPAHEIVVRALGDGQFEVGAVFGDDGVKPLSVRLYARDDAARRIEGNLKLLRDKPRVEPGQGKDIAVVDRRYPVPARLGVVPTREMVAEFGDGDERHALAECYVVGIGDPFVLSAARVVCHDVNFGRPDRVKSEIASEPRE